MNFKIKLNLTKSNSKTIFNLLQKYVHENEKGCLVRFEDTQSDGLGTLTEMFYPETDKELLDMKHAISAKYKDVTFARIDEEILL